MDTLFAVKKAEKEPAESKDGDKEDPNGKRRIKNIFIRGRLHSRNDLTTAIVKDPKGALEVVHEHDSNERGRGEENNSKGPS